MDQEIEEAKNEILRIRPILAKLREDVSVFETEIRKINDLSDTLHGTLDSGQTVNLEQLYTQMHHTRKMWEYRIEELGVQVSGMNAGHRKVEDLKRKLAETLRNLDEYHAQGEEVMQLDAQYTAMKKELPGIVESLFMKLKKKQDKINEEKRQQKEQLHKEKLQKEKEKLQKEKEKLQKEKE
jgi:hypothetical protein